MHLLRDTPPKSVIAIWTAPPINREAGYLYFEVHPWSQDAPVYLKVRSKGATLRGIRFWLNRIVNWDNVGMVTHLN